MQLSRTKGRKATPYGCNASPRMCPKGRALVNQTPLRKSMQSHMMHACPQPWATKSQPCLFYTGMSRQGPEPHSGEDKNRKSQAGYNLFAQRQTLRGWNTVPGGQKGRGPTFQTGSSYTVQAAPELTHQFVSTTGEKFSHFQIIFRNPLSPETAICLGVPQSYPGEPWL